MGNGVDLSGQISRTLRFVKVKINGPIFLNAFGVIGNFETHPVGFAQMV